MNKNPLNRTTTQLLAVLGLCSLLTEQANAQTAQFKPGHLAVLQLGDGGTNRSLPLNGGSVAIPYTNYAASDIAASRQTALYVGQFDPNGLNQSVAEFQVAVPTNGLNGLFINGNAGTEGNMTLAGDRSRLAVTGYAGDLLSIVTGQQTAPSNLSYDRGIGTIDAFGTYNGVYRGGGWYGIATGKTNPRGVATDGMGNFWGCGNGYGSLFFNAVSAPDPIQFQNIALTSCSKVINQTLYASVKNSESVNLYPAGIYSFVDFFNRAVAAPNAASFLHLEIPAQAPYVNCVGFDINPDKTVAYVTDASTSGGGIQKYIRSGLTWKLAYNLSIPGYYGLNSGIRTNAASTNVLVGAFSVTVDWNGTNPVVYATTTDSGWSSGNPYYGNRVIRINDTNAVSSGTNIIVTTNMNILTTVVRPGLDAGGFQITNIVYKSVTFAPDLRPVVTNNPINWSAVAGDSVSFSVGASSSSPMSYQWLQNGTNLAGGNSALLSVNPAALGLDGYGYQCVVSNTYGAVTSSVAILSVSSEPTAPAIGSIQNITNYVGNDQVITAAVGGTDPKGGFRWFLNGILLSDGPTGIGSTLSGAGTGSLSIGQAAVSDAGVYSLVVTNRAGSTSNVVANFTTLYATPVMIQPPAPATAFLGRPQSLASSAYGVQLTYRWYVSTKTNLSGTTLTPLPEGAHFTGTATPSLQIATVLGSDATNFVVVVSNPGGSITSAPAPFTVINAPYHTFIFYTNSGQAYRQDFNSLPIPGGGSAEGANPVHITYVMTNFAQMVLNAPYANANMASELQYSTDNPIDFGFPIIPSGSIGGLGLSNKMDGWYGWAQNALVFAATKGDQSQGAIVDNGGNYYSDGAPLTGITNRALGLVATAKSGTVAFGAAVINKSTNTFNKINLSYTGQLWRNNPSPQPLLFGYFIDRTGTNSTFHPDQWDSTNAIAYVNSLNVSFPTSAATQVLDGTYPSNQVSVSASGLSIANWPPGAALWLVWQGQTIGSAQNIAVDDLTFSVVSLPGAVSQPASGLAPKSSTVNGLVTAAGVPASYYFEYGTNQSYGSFTGTNSVSSGASSLPVYSVLSGLRPNTVYHFRLVASNSQGVTPGNDALFATPAIPPSQLAATRLGGTSSLQLGFTNYSGLNFTVITSTNILLPLSQWDLLGTPSEISSGQYRFTDPQPVSGGARYYILLQP